MIKFMFKNVKHVHTTAADHTVLNNALDRLKVTLQISHYNSVQALGHLHCAIQYAQSLARHHLQLVVRFTILNPIPYSWVFETRNRMG